MLDDASQRYRRQRNAFPETRRGGSALAVLCAAADPGASMALMAGAAAMGVPAVGADCPDGPVPGGHWLVDDCPAMVAKINPEVRYEYLDPDLPAADAARLARGHPNAWAAVLLNDPAPARAALRALAADEVDLRILLVLSAPGGVLVEAHASPAAALARLDDLPAGRLGAAVGPGPIELALLVGGVCLNELMQASRPLDADAGFRRVAFYSLHRPRRVTTTAEAGPGELLRELAVGPGGATASFARRSLVMVGAGALANWAAVPIALEVPARLVVHDGDPEVAEHNINRQVLLVDGVGTGRAKARVLVDELRALAAGGCRCEPVAEFVRGPADLSPTSADALICAPDNDAARLTGSDAALAAGVPYATGGTSAVGGQAVVCVPGRACYRCVAGAGVRPSGAGAGAEQSCARVAADAVVASNMAVAGMLVSELRQALSGRAPANVRFAGDSAAGNRLVRMISNPPCPHVRPAQPVET